MDYPKGILINWEKQRTMLKATLPAEPTGTDLVTLCHLSALDHIEQQQREIDQLRTFLQESIGNNERALSTTNDKWFAGVVFAYKEVLELLSINKEVSTDVQDDR